MNAKHTEIERKFLVTSETWKQGSQRQHLCQGYLSRDPDRTVRVRIAEESAFLTIKGRPAGISRVEVEFPISLAEAQALLPLCLPPLIEKTRYTVNHAGMVWEVDEFHGLNAGLVVAEIELPSAVFPFARPDWLGIEVSQDPRYANSQLSVTPFSAWTNPPSAP